MSVFNDGGIMLKRWYILVATVILSSLTIIIGLTSAIWSAQNQSYKHLQYLSKIASTSEQAVVWTDAIQDIYFTQEFQQFVPKIKDINFKLNDGFDDLTQNSFITRLLIGTETYDELVRNISIQFSAFQRTSQQLQNSKTILDIKFFADSLNVQAKHGLGIEIEKFLTAEHAMIAQLGRMVLSFAWFILPAIALIMCAIWTWMISPIFVRMKTNWKQLKIVQEETQKAADLATKASVEKTKFLSVISHEFRTPLNAVIGCAEHLSINESRLIPEINEALFNILKNSQDLSVMIDGMLDYSTASNDDRPTIDQFMENMRINQDKIVINKFDIGELDKDFLSKDISILAADDNRMNRKIIEKLVNGLGGKLDMVEDGEQAVTAWKNKTYDMLLFDIAMPNKTGDQALSLIRDLENCENRERSLAIAITANTLPEQVDGYYEAGFDDCISKPLTRKKLKQSILMGMKKLSSPKRNAISSKAS